MVKKTTDTKIKRYRNPHGRCFHQNQTDLPLKLLYSEVSQVTQTKKKIMNRSNEIRVFRGEV